MKKLYKFLPQFFKKKDSIVVDDRSFFDYSSGEKIKLMRAAGREAQKEQQKLVKSYEVKFGKI